MEGCHCSSASSSLAFSTNVCLPWSRSNTSTFTTIYGRNELKKGELFVPQIVFMKSKNWKWIARRHRLANHFSFDSRKDESQLRNDTEVKITNGILSECGSSFWEILKKSSIKFYCWWKLSLSINCNTSEWANHPQKFAQLQRWQKKLKRRRFAFLFGSTIAFLFIMSTAVNIGKNSSWALTEENLLFLEAWRTIDRAYIDKTFNGQSWFRYREAALRHEPMNTREETYAAIRKMLATLDDPFTRFLEPEKFKNLKSGTEGAVIGVGLEVGFDIIHNGASANLLVISPVPGGPADRAGIMPGDLILAINGTSTQGMGLYDAAERLQGPEDSVVELTLREGDFGSRTVSLKREKITLNPVSWRLCEISRVGKDPLKIGYIKLTIFNQNASRAVKEAIKTLRENKVTSYVLDLRNNSGGLFPEGIEIAKIWLDKSVIVYICDSKGVRDIYETDGSEAIATSEPLVVLLNSSGKQESTTTWVQWLMDGRIHAM